MMRKLKQFILSLIGAIIIPISLLGILLFGCICYDKVTDGAIISAFSRELLKDGNFYFRTVERSLLTILEKEIDSIKGNVSSYFINQEFQTLSDYAQDYHFEYFISTVQGRPMVTSKGWYTNTNTWQELSFTIEGDNQYLIRLHLPYNPLNEHYYYFGTVWNLFYNRLGLSVALLFLSVFLLFISIIYLLRYATVSFKVCLTFCYITIIEFLCISLLDVPNLIGVFSICGAEKLILLCIVFSYLRYLKRLHRSVREIGTPHSKENPKNSFYPISLRPFAKDIEAASRSVSAAIDDRLKSDRMKTELISNVSHDIKTPLTSIINFSDLIASEKTENPFITEYATHLHAQSIRLKNLLESLIEASKASSGAVDIHMVPCKVQTLLEQCVVEYEEKLSEKGIALIILPPKEPIMIQADVNALSRIFENLLANILKYSLPNSRAYIEVQKSADSAILSFRNISETPCNLSSDELTERFVRGDASRHSEGHGLGLSIVKSLMDLMQGDLKISSQYDLFEVKLIFPLTK